MDDFTTVVEEIRRSNAEEAKRDKYRLEQATAHSKKNSQLLEKALDRDIHIDLDGVGDVVGDAIDDQTAAFEVTATKDDSDDTPPSVKAEEDDDDKKNQQTLVKLLGGIGDGIDKLFNDAKNFIGDTPTVMQALLAAGGFFLLAEFLQSPMAQDIIMTIFDSLKQLFGDIATLSQDFTVGGLIDLVKNNFLTLIGILTAFKPKMMFNLAKKAVMGLAGMFDGAANFFKEGGMDKILSSVGGSLKGMREGLGNFAKSLKRNSALGTLGMEGSMDKKIKGAFKSFTTSFGKDMDSFNTGLNKLGNGIAGTFNSLGKTLSEPGGMKKILSAAKLAMGSYFAAMKATIVGSFKFLLGILMANPITAIIIGIVALLAGLATYFGVFDPLFEAVASVFSSIKGFFVGLYNSFADTYLGRKLGLTPMVDDTGPTPVTPAPVNTNTQTAEVIEENALNKTAANMNTADGAQNTVVTTNAPVTTTNNTTQSNISIIDTDRLFRHLTNMTI